MPGEAKFIELDGGDGEAVSCQVIEYVPFKGKEDVVLLHPETGEPVVMEHPERDGRSVFSVTMDDAKFEQVSDFIRELARKEGGRP